MICRDRPSARKIHPGNESPPLFLLYGEPDAIDQTKHLFDSTILNIPIYGICVWPNTTKQSYNIQTLASNALNTIKTLQPIGPYYLAGSHGAGLHTLELAYQLIGQDAQVAFLGLISPTVFSESVIDLYSPWSFESSKTGEYAKRHSPSQEAVPSPTTKVYLFLNPGQEDQEVSRLLAAADGLEQSSTVTVPVTNNKTLGATGISNTPSLAGALNIAILNSRKSTASSLQNPYHPIVVLQASATSSTTLFCLPGAGASASSFLELSNELSTSLTVVALQPRGLDGEYVPHSAIVPCASSYLKDIQTGRRNQNLSLLGHSLGGWIALELALQLSAQNYCISSLTILDSEPPDLDALELRETTDIDILLDWIKTIEILKVCSLNVDRITLERLNRFQQRELLHQRLRDLKLLPARSTSEILRGPLATFAAGIRMCYSPDRPYLGTATIVFAATNHDGEKISDLILSERVRRWKTWLPNATFRSIPGSHLTIMQSPYVKNIASLLAGLEPQRVKVR